jgi:hypothetical protein
MPPPPRNGGPAATKIRNTASPRWSGWLKPENGCLAPASSFADMHRNGAPRLKRKDVAWFALDDKRPLFAFAGIWATFRGDRGTIPGPDQDFNGQTRFGNRRGQRACPEAAFKQRNAKTPSVHHAIRAGRCIGASANRTALPR